VERERVERVGEILRGELVGAMEIFGGGIEGKSEKEGYGASVEVGVKEGMVV
jgi:hypothetical protein